MSIYSPANDKRYRCVTEIVKVAPHKYECHLWYVTHDDHDRAILGDPLQDAIYRKGFREPMRRVEEVSARRDEITKLVRGLADSVCVMTRDFIAEHSGC